MIEGVQKKVRSMHKRMTDGNHKQQHRLCQMQNAKHEGGGLEESACVRVRVIARGIKGEVNKEGKRDGKQQAEEEDERLRRKRIRGEETQETFLLIKYLQRKKSHLD